MSSLIIELLGPWIRTQRWFPAKGEEVEFTFLDSWDISDPLELNLISLVTIEARGQTEQWVLQVPLVVAQEAPAGIQVIGNLGGTQLLLDGAAHPSFIRAWSQLHLPGFEAAQPFTHSAISSEQSNSSVVIRQGSLHTIIKVLRVLHDGEHPEVQVLRVLTQMASSTTPALLGFGNLMWRDGDGHEHTAINCIATEYLEAAHDGYELLRARANDESDFTAEIRSLGSDLAELHHTLATYLTPDGRILDLGTELHQRADAALTRVTPLQKFSAAIHARLSHAPLDDATLQRIHGDLHLGQVLWQRGRWYVIDFEGEVLRDLTSRRQADHPLRDVAGILRSLAYAAGGRHATWLDAHQAAFLEGYFGAQPGTRDQQLLDAFVLDRALYEAVYEHQNRPDWLEIPLEAITTIVKESIMPASDPTPEPSPAQLDGDILGEIGRGEYFAPHDALGPHLNAGGVTIRTVQHLAKSVTVQTPDGTYPATHEGHGVWVVVLADREVPDYRLQVDHGDGIQMVDDPYRYLPTLGEVDLHLIGEGRHERLWEVLGAHQRSYSSHWGQVEGTSFAVWAPNAQAVRVVGDFNGWDGRAHMMRSLGSSGVWELFIPGIGVGARYKFEISTPAGWRQKADPLARQTEIPPATASIVAASAYEWKDASWLQRRANGNAHAEAMSIYEVHLGSWRQGLDYRELADQLTDYVSWLGFTHVEFLPVAEHPYGPSWGYQVTSFYAPTSRFGNPDEFRHLVDTLHGAGIGVILDWVPAHFPKDAWALAEFDGTKLYEHPDPNRGEHPDWGTLVFNYGRNEVRNFLVANAIYWLSEFHIDGLRVDAVASMLYLDYSRQPGQWSPNERGGREHLEAIDFLQELNASAYRINPGIVMIAEESTAWPGVTASTDTGGLGFGLKWNMGWMHDTLHYLSEEPINRRYHHGELTFSLVYAFSENYVLPLSHDEVVHGKGSLLGKMPGDVWQQLANLRALFSYQWTHPGKKLLFMGSEFGQPEEWGEGRSLNWWISDTEGHAGLRLLIRDLNRLYVQNSALWDDHVSGFEWIEAADGDHNVLAYIRRNGEHCLIVVINFAGTAHHDYRLALPFGGQWREVLNSDAQIYGGSGVGNAGMVQAMPGLWSGRAHSALVNLPPLGAIILHSENAS